MKRRLPDRKKGRVLLLGQHQDLTFDHKSGKESQRGIDVLVMRTRSWTSSDILSGDDMGKH